MNVKFLQDFRGKETNEMFYANGAIVDLPENGAWLAERGIVTTDFVVPEPEPVEEEHDIEEMTVDELKQQADDLGIEYKARIKKDELKELVLAATGE